MIGGNPMAGGEFGPELLAAQAAQTFRAGASSLTPAGVDRYATAIEEITLVIAASPDTAPEDAVRQLALRHKVGVPDRVLYTAADQAIGMVKGLRTQTIQSEQEGVK